MAYINQPPDLRLIFHDITNRLEKLERAQRFTAPNVNITTTPPSNPRTGDIFFDTATNKLVFWNGTNWRKITDSVYP
jgi:hypothetical protein